MNIIINDLPGFFKGWIADLSKRYLKKTEAGWNSTLVDVVLRMLVVKHLYGYSYEDTIERVKGGLNLQRFCRVYLNDMPVDATLIRWANLRERLKSGRVRLENDQV